jgi:hypothetical protein
MESLSPIELLVIHQLRAKVDRAEKRRKLRQKTLHGTRQNEWWNVSEEQDNHFYSTLLNIVERHVTPIVNEDKLKWPS